MATLKLVQKDGDKVTWRFRVTNTSGIDCSGTEVAFTIPDGLLLTGPLMPNGVTISVPVGSYNPTTKTWLVGELLAGASTPYADWEFTVEDISLISPLDNSFYVKAVVTSRCDETTSIDNTLELIIKEGEECTEINISVGGTEGSSGTDVGNLQISV